jgi:hypothetical protein
MAKKLYEDDYDDDFDEEDGGLGESSFEEEFDDDYEEEQSDEYWTAENDNRIDRAMEAFELIKEEIAADTGDEDFVAEFEDSIENACMEMVEIGGDGQPEAQKLAKLLGLTNPEVIDVIAMYLGNIA